ncbi:MAG: hypothetical protein A3B70_01655 [Deltaproteobacteria bacterium RIFCSPHIGHO2_02_FULL_40_11]|nr:MAG: hypothetical protein A3B70_01655 [Deltaproteobacteria bacterium RIFCSPHIGHO2_02_FULL_40_11]
MRLSTAGASDIGKVRKMNQDRYICNDDAKLYVVADGMGGHQAGDVAAKMAVDELNQTFSFKKHSLDPEKHLVQTIHNANAKIYESAKENSEFKGMGTTVTALYFTMDSVYIAHVGDSRAYLMHGKHIWQLTEDHSLASNEMVSGLNVPLKNVLTRSVGYDPQVEVALYVKKLSKGDRFLICSDGLHGNLSSQEMVHAITKRFSLADGCKNLIQSANAKGGDDNITAVLISVDEV